MSDVIIFGGTTEGRLLAEACAERKIQAVVCVVSDYGKWVLPESPWLNIHRQAMTEAEMVSMIQNEHPRMVMDATHPYAAVVTEHVSEACRTTGVQYIRIARAKSPELALNQYNKCSYGEENCNTENCNKENCNTENSNTEAHNTYSRHVRKEPILNRQDVIWKETVEAAVEYLQTVEGSVFVTTGSKELETYTHLPDYSARLYVRVLPGSENLAVCESLGICGNHVIAMQGPFSREMNVAMLHQTGASYLVTKEAGAAGGFQEKIEAALECGVTPIVIGRPKKPEGITLEEGITFLNQEFGINDLPVQLNLVGIGMGGSGQMTQEAVAVLRQSEIILGAERMIQSVETIAPGIPKEPIYLSRDVLQWLESHREYRKISVVYSGDTGFYSGAKTLLKDLKQSDQHHHIQTTVYPGISTAAYLCAKLQTSWDDVYLASAHGRVQDELELLRHHDRVLLLLGGEDAVKNLCRKLAGNGYAKVTVSVGERLSYPDERIVTGNAEDVQDYSFGSLTAVLLEQ